MDDDELAAEMYRLTAEVQAQQAAQAPTKPSRESMREVKREAKEREKARQAQQQDAAAYWAQQTGKQVSTGGRPRRAALVVGAVATVAAVGAAGWILLAPKASSGQPAAAPASAGPKATPSPHASPKTTAKATPTATPPATPAAVVDPFGVTPARRWSKGAAGIVIPTHAHAGLYSQSELADAFAKTKRYLEAAILDPAVLYRGKLDPVLATMGQDSRGNWRERAAKPTAGVPVDKRFSWVGLANRFHPGDWRVVSPIVRVNGKMTPGLEKDFLKVDFVYVAAYWLRPAAGGLPRAVLVRREGTTEFFGHGGGSVSSLWVSGGTGSTTASICGATWPHAQYVDAWPDPSKAVRSSGEPATLPAFDLGNPDSKGPEGCFTDTSGF